MLERLKEWYRRKLDEADKKARALYLLRAQSYASYEVYGPCVICQSHASRRRMALVEGEVPQHDCQRTRCIACASARLAAYEDHRWLLPYPGPHECLDESTPP